MSIHFSCAAAAAISVLAHSTGNAADVLDPVTVTGSADAPAISPVHPEDLPALRDTADMLRDIPGVSGSRMGGHGIDPTIRGLSQTQLNILLDGAYIHGGCPNRMDPPTSYAPIASYEDITVIKGVQTLEYGGGGPGGTILFERVTPRFGDDEPLRGSVDAGYRENGEVWEVAGDIAGGTRSGFARLIASYTESANYEDGGGNEVRSAFDETSGTLILGYTPSDATRLEFSFEKQETRDLLFAGAGMDSPLADSDTYRLKFVSTDHIGPLAAMKAEVYRSDVDHVMDNYTLRTPVNPMMLMRAPSTSNTTGGRLVGEVDSSLGRWKLGIDVQDNARDAIRVNDFNDRLNSLMWPDVDTDQRGVFTELTHELNRSDRIIAGLRYDHVTSNAGKANVAAEMPARTPNELYAIYNNGAQAKERTEHNVGGLLRWEHDLASGLGTVYTGLSRTVRTADATERYMASNTMNETTPMGLAMRWVGNPAIDPEKHHQLEVGAQLQRGAWNLDASVYYNDVDDYILRDRAHLPAALGGNATIYRNVDATLYGMETTLGYRWSENWRSTVGLAYVHADNDTDDRPIAQTPPLEAVASLDYAVSTWEAGARIRAAAKQTRVDDDPLTGSGLDVGKTSGWGVLDLYGRYRLSAGARLDFGVDNVFDKEYAQHLNRSSAFDPIQVQVNEPGLSAWVKFNAEF